jgi:hypothetical protein
VQFAQIYDRVDVDESDGVRVDVSALLGDWVNSNPETSGIARMSLKDDGGGLVLEVQAVGPEGLISWGAAPVEVFAASPSSRVAAGFACVYDFGFAETRLQAMLLKGLAVLAQFHSFKDGSGRADFFVREYFGLEHGRY